MTLTSVPVLYGIDPWNNEQYAQLPLGAIGYDQFGNKYRYVQQNASTPAVLGTVQAPAAFDTNYTNMAVPSAAPLITTGTNKFPNTKIPVTLGGTAVTANQFENGTLVINAGTGIGQQFTIKSHDVQASTSGLCNFVAYEPLSVALDTTSKVTILTNQYKNVVVAPASSAGNPLGVALNTIPAKYFGWLGTHGVFGARSDATGTHSAGLAMGVSAGTSGDVTLWVTTYPALGQFLVVGASAEVRPQWFNLN